MTNNIRAALSPLLLISYIFGTRVIKYPADQPKLWYSCLYLLLLWSVYYTLLAYTLVDHLQTTSFTYQLCFWMNIVTALLTVLLGMYYDKKFRSCLRKLAIVDDTLKKLGIIIDYHKLHVRVLWTILGWLVFSLWRIYCAVLWHGTHNNFTKTIYTAFMLEYSSYVNFLDDLIITNTLGYIELKFGQINEYIELESDKKHVIKKAWEGTNLHLRPTTYPKSTSNTCVTWIVIHLHLELRKISRELNSIFGLQLTIKMSTYFAFIALGFREIFNVTMLKNYEYSGTLYVISGIIYPVYIVRPLIINYMCEKVTVKANSTGDVITKLPYSTYNAVIQENILQFLLQMRLIPLRFYGLGLFQFGLKFFQRFCTSLTTVIVIFLQSHTNTPKIERECKH